MKGIKAGLVLQAKLNSWEFDPQQQIEAKLLSILNEILSVCMDGNFNEYRKESTTVMLFNNCVLTMKYAND